MPLSQCSEFENWLHPRLKLINKLCETESSVLNAGFKNILGVVHFVTEAVGSLIFNRKIPLEKQCPT